MSNRERGRRKTRGYRDGPRPFRSSTAAATSKSRVRGSEREVSKRKGGPARGSARKRRGIGNGRCTNRMLTPTLSSSESSQSSEPSVPLEENKPYDFNSWEWRKIAWELYLQNNNKNVTRLPGTFNIWDLLSEMQKPAYEAATRDFFTIADETPPPPPSPYNIKEIVQYIIYNERRRKDDPTFHRKDLISAMKLPDNEPLTPSEYWVITDPWKQDWERGVQVPVNPDSLPAPKVKIIDNPQPPGQAEFKLPKDKYIHLSRDTNYSSEKHQLSATPACAEAACAYDLDATDTCWLLLLNGERARAGAAAVTEDQFEKVIEELEVRTWDKIQAIMKSEEGLGIEYDENVICDVCRSPDSEDGNEMVFCDSCNICVHQACYGITVIPEGQWLCRPCGDGARPTCVLCPNQGGAMKCTPSGHKWAHVSCVLWIPEVSIGCAEKMEPITKISSIPASRWSLMCVLCRERKGACIQCSVKSCKTAYHVTCAFKHGLEMRAIIEDENADDGVKLRSYCQKHSVNSKKEKPGSGSEEEEVKRKRRKDMTSEEKTQARAARLHEIEKEFDKHVSVKDISSHLLEVDQEAIHYIYSYWKMKRRSGHNRPLLPPKSDDNELLSHRQEQADLDKMKQFVQLRQDLERVRNLCYMVSRREKLSRSFFRLREQTFHKQLAVLSSGAEIAAEELAAIQEANHGPSIYDTLYSHPDVPEHKFNFEDLLAKIAPPDSNDDKKKDRNGLRRSKSSNPYRKHYVNGSRRSGSMYSGLSSEESDAEIARPSKYRPRAVGSTTDDEDTGKKPSVSSPKKKVSPKSKAVKKSPKKTDKKKKKVPQSKAVVESSSEDDVAIAHSLKDKTGSKTLRQMEKEMTAGKGGQSASDSDDLLPIRSTRSTKFPMDIYSDSSEDSANDKAVVTKDIDKVKDDKLKSKKSPKMSDPQQSLPRTKAAMKEFIPSHSEKKESVVTEEKSSPKKRGRKPSIKEKKPPPPKPPISDDEAKNKENKFSKPKDNPTDLIVPQRQAAKKASENMRSTSTGKKEENATEKSPEEVKIKAKGKGKGKEIKSPPAKLTRQASKDADKETIAYVPQRQAAKKAAAHIKNIGSKVPAPETGDANKKKEEKQESSKSSDESPSKKKQEKEESSSSSSGSSSSSDSSSSSSEYEESEKTGPKPANKAREIKPAVAAKPPSLFSPPSARPTVDLPFLDKVSKPLSSTSASSDSDSRSDGSGASSPTPKRPRRRRKHASDDASPRKALDTKLKTSVRESERGVSPPAAEREEHARAAGACAATRARTRSTTAVGSLPDLPDARPRKPSKDDLALAASPDKTSKEGRQSGELPPPERKTHETLKGSPKETRRRSSPKARRRSSVIVDRSPNRSPARNDLKLKATKVKGASVSVEKDKPPETQPSPLPAKPSPKKNVEQRRKSISSRRMSVKETSQKDAKDQVVPTAEEVIAPIKQRRQSRYETRDTKTTRENASPGKKSISDKPQAAVPDKKTSVRMNDEYNDSEKWLPKAPSPTHVLTPIERPGGNEKYMTDDKSFDSADVCTEKSSVNMIAKIQANLNENTMIKSPRTPMDARSLAPEEEAKNLRKRSTLEAVTQQDASHVQGVEISKSAKIPSTVYHDRPPTSPQQKDNELFAFDMLAVDDGFNHDEILKPFSSFPEFFFKEDSKEQGRQETLNLVDRLRIQLSAKKAPENCQQEQSTEDKDHMTDDHRLDDYRRDDYRGEDYGEDHRVEILKDEDHRMQDLNSLPVEHNKHDGQLSPDREIRQEMETHVVASPQQHHNTMNHIQHSIAPAEMPRRKSVLEDKEYHQMAMTSNDKWHAGMALGDTHTEHETRKYDHSAYTEQGKEVGAREPPPATDVVTGQHSKQSDDSQPSCVDNSNGAIDVETIREHARSYDNKETAVVRGECSPYAGREPQWRESEIPRRRSSTSSTDSEASGARDPHVVAGVMPEIDSYPPIPAYSCPVEPSMPLNQYATYAPDASPFLTTMSSLFGGGACSQLPLPSPGPLYAPALSYSAAGLLPAKPPYRRLCAAFTSSSQNIALTTAMIAPPTPKPLDSPAAEDAGDLTLADKFSVQASSPTICVDDSTYETSQSRTTKVSNDSDDTTTSVSQQECKSPAKTTAPIKTVLKFPGKSPGKSPGISPKRSETSKGSKRSSNRSNRGQRGRGRSKSRGHGAHSYPSGDYLGDSIRNKLVGTVYDFEEEIANDGVDLKALRERRKSVDVRDDRRSEHSYKDTSQSPSVHSPPQRASKKTPTGEPKEYRPAVEEPQAVEESASVDEARALVHVPPLLPGPVDMRTYQPEAAPAEYSCPTLAYSAAAAERHLADLEEEHGPPPPAPAAHHHSPAQHHHHHHHHHHPPPALPPPPPLDAYVPMPKVSLSDSRNQLKVKIKGPFLDANYCASVAVPPAPAPAPPLEPPVGVLPAAVAAGSTSLRRMRKKELLRQYWTQDMNMDEPASGAVMGAAPPPAAPPPPRAVITIPKAVASMTSIPTREDYKILEPPVLETKKKRKVSSGLSRELRHLKVTMNDEAEAGEEARLAHKRRARLSTKPGKTAPNPPLAPKLKIKIGADTLPHVTEEPFDFRPPKKRHVHKPTLEDLRRESMKYRKMVMADFEENEKTAKHKSSKSEKRKKKKEKKGDKLQVVNSKSESAPKLIIKIKRPTTERGEGGQPSAAAAVVDPFDYDPTAPDPLALDTPCHAEGLSAMRKVRTAKVTPIRLKLARTQGSSYVMAGGASPAPAAPGPAAALPPGGASAPAPVPPDEHSDVR